MRKKALCYLAVTLNAITMKKALFISLCALLLAGTGCKKKAEPEPQKVAVTGVSLMPNTLSLKVGEAETLSAVVIPANADNKTVSWSTSDQSVATVANGLVTAVKEGSATITVTTIDGGKTATCTVTVNSAIPAYEAVDLGLSVKWANKNLGAEFPEDAGNYYAWGELETKPVYSWNSYKFLTAEGGYISKYTADAWEAATVDYLTLLEEEDDVAHKILGDKWRLPTPAEWNELHNHTNRQNSQNGMYAKASNGNSIFLPYGGMYYSNDGAELYLKGREGFYWTSSLGNSNSSASCAWLAGGGINMSIYIVRSAGLAIRAVYGERPPEPTIINPTAEDLGKVIGADGKIYTNTQAAVSAGTKAAAVIVYVGSDTAEDGFTHGLAMSMRDCSNTSGYKWKTSDGTYDNPQQNSDLHTLLNLHESGKSLTTSDRDNDTWPAFKAALHNSITVTDGITADAPDGTSGWFLPSMFQWQQAIHAMTGKTVELSLFDANADYTNDKFSTKIADSEAHLGKFCYASSSEFDATYNWHFDFNDGIARRNAKWCTYYVRAFLAF